ncbi:hypothetical protein BBP40_001627 [Aspergillus hancockii]|nr:hypothetical protein BBP40_001627 [Aspergillus hancockii]
MSFKGDEEFNIINSFFIGPKGANLPDFRANINTILDELLEARLNYMPEDTRFISKDVRRSKEFQAIRDMVGNVVRKTAQVLGEHSVPFWSPRYEGHMNTDLTMASALGYFMTMLYNPNNVALESSPLTTVAEYQVGQDLCDLFEYNTDPKNTDLPLAWGHITCDGTIANLESIWVARNLKFYPLALKRAMTEGALSFIPDFEVETCQGAPKNFRTMDTWELLNLQPKTVLDLPDNLRKWFGITSDFLTKALKDFNIQTTGRGPLEKKFGIDQPIQYFLGKTRHYSWPKGTAIAGIGDGNITEIDVDLDARVDIGLLTEKLMACAKKHQAVYAVVAIMGSTEEGAVERLSKILEIRETMQNDYGMSFLVHADAAWGSYFATMLNPAIETPGEKAGNRLRLSKGEFVPSLCLKKETDEDLRALKDADSITVDPHKAGYGPYPAGSLVYRDGRMSKPGAAAMSTWLSNNIIGLHPKGYGMLLGEAAFTSAILSAHYATMGHTPAEKEKNKYFVCVPLNRLEVEKNLGRQSFFTPEVQKERQWIRDNILGKDNAVIQDTEGAIEKLRELGSDLNINAFALNWYDEEGNLNTDLEEANYLMKQVVDTLSITTTDTDPSKIPVFLTSTKFEPKLYGKCAQKFMDRLGVNPCQQDMFVIRNVVMSPFPTQRDFVSQLMKALEGVIISNVGVCRDRNRRGASEVEFLAQGSTKVFLVLQTSFYWATLRQQVIVEAELGADFKESYTRLKTDYPGEIVILGSATKIDLEVELKKLASGGTSEFDAKIYRKKAPDTTYTGSVSLTRVVKSCPLNSANRDLQYPDKFMPFYLYGSNDEKHISHMLLKAPNAALSASNVSFNAELHEKVHSQLSAGLIVTLSKIPEAPMQPFPTDNKLPEFFPFKRNGEFEVKVWKDPNGPESKGPGLLNDLKDLIGTGKMTLGVEVDLDAGGPNKDQLDKSGIDPKPVERALQEIKDLITRGRGAASLL